MTDNMPNTATSPATDERGRPAVESLTDRALLVELVHGQRMLMDAVNDAMENPMVAGMLSGQNPIMAMIGRG